MFFLRVSGVILYFKYHSSSASGSDTETIDIDIHLADASAACAAVHDNMRSPGGLEWPRSAWGFQLEVTEPQT